MLIKNKKVIDMLNFGREVMPVSSVEIFKLCTISVGNRKDKLMMIIVKAYDQRVGLGWHDNIYLRGSRCLINYFYG